MKMRVRAIPDYEETGNRKPRTRERELPVFRDPRNRETRQENKGVLVNSGALILGKKAQNTHFLGCKSVAFYDSGSPGTTVLCKMLHFSISKMSRFALSDGAAGGGKSISRAFG